MRWGKQDDPLFQCSQYRYQGTPCPLNPQVWTNAFHPTCWLWRVSRTFSYLWDTNEASEQIHESSSRRHFRFTFSTIFIEMSLHNLAVVTFLIFAGKKTDGIIFCLKSICTRKKRWYWKAHAQVKRPMQHFKRIHIRWFIKNSKWHPKQAAKAAIKPKKTFRAMWLDAVLMRDGCLEFKAVVSRKCKFWNVQKYNFPLHREVLSYGQRLWHQVQILAQDN